MLLYVIFFAQMVYFQVYNNVFSIYSTGFWLISFLGFTCVENKITKEDINIYQTWQIELKNKNFEKADYLRKQLLDKGLI
mgnify:CR=1 FL=1